MIEKSATNPLRFARRFAFTSSARVAWRLILESISFPDGTSMLLPAYVGITEREGSGISDPIEQTRAPYTLYRVDDHLRPVTDELENMIATGKHPLLLVVHYFGIVHVDLQRLKAVCERHNTVLVEDCAHVPWPLHSDSGPGSVGDAAFYSLHKSIAVPTGGILRVNDSQMSLSPVRGTDCCDRACLEQFIRTDMDAVASKRRRNYRWLVDRLSNVNGVTVMYADIGDLVPHDFPIRIHDGLREKLYFKLLKENLPTIALYYRLIAAITPDDFPVSHAVSRSILNLPVHQDTDTDDLEYLTERLVAILERLRE